MKFPDLFVLGVCMMVPLAVTAGAAIPAGVWIGPKTECHSPRFEVDGGSAAYLWQCGNLMWGTVTGSEDALHLAFRGQPPLELTKDGEGWKDAAGARWVPRASVLPKHADWTPVSVRLVDEDGKPLGSCGASYTITDAGGTHDPLLVRPLSAKEGVLEILAPADCEISLEVDHPEVPRGVGTNAAIVRKQAAKQYDAKFRRGRTVSGKVLADATGKPVAGASVAPMMFMSPSFCPDMERAVLTDKDGRFAVRGVDAGLCVTHPDYVKADEYMDDKITSVVIRLGKGKSVRGRVVDVAGKPLPGVEVESGTGRTAVTGDDGRFEIRGLEPSDENYGLSFEKEGYAKLNQPLKGKGGKERVFTMKTLPLLRGRVLMPDGTPARRYVVVCGPGANPPDYRCIKMEADSPDGTFSIKPGDIAEDGTYWLGIKADGAAPWDGAVRLPSGDQELPLVKLAGGGSLKAVIALPGAAAGPFRADLTAVDRAHEEDPILSAHPGADLAAQKAEFGHGAPLVFHHLRPGIYQLIVSAKGATPLLRKITVGTEPLDLGELRLAGTGSIRGMARDPDGSGKPWKFARGEIYFVGGRDSGDEAPMTFHTDAAGKFRVDGVPVGDDIVQFRIPTTSDILESVSRHVRVREGRETEVYCEGATGAARLPLRLLFDGDQKIPSYAGARVVKNINDRSPMFLFTADPVGDGPASWPDGISWDSDGGSQPHIPDLSNGSWRVRVYDWSGSTGFERDALLAETVVLTPAVPRTAVSLNLGALALTGKILAKREGTRMIQVVAVDAATKRCFRTRCDSGGNFILRYLPAGSYRLHAHDDEGGWCDAGSHQPGAVAVDCGSFKLQPGGHAAGKVTVPGGGSGPLQVIAEAGDGLKVIADEVKDDGTFRIGNLRPGEWTVAAYQQDREIFRQAVSIKAGVAATVPPADKAAPGARTDTSPAPNR